MGHTILAHALFACNQIDIDPGTLFSIDANVHAIQKLNTSNLTCCHAFDFPEQAQGIEILSVECLGWDEILRHILSYHKFFKFAPDQTNLDLFYDSVNHSMDPLEYLTLSYFDSYELKMSHNSPHLALSDYVNYNIEPLQSSLQRYLGWSWDDYKGRFFHNIVLDKNQKYLDLLHYLQLVVTTTVNKIPQQCNLNFYQKALVISMVCKSCALHPSLLHWNTVKYLERDNQSLIDSLNRL